jgi:hypothetical protein
MKGQQDNVSGLKGNGEGPRLLTEWVYRGLFLSDKVDEAARTLFRALFTAVAK